LVYSGSLSSGTPSLMGPRRQISIVKSRDIYNSTYLGPQPTRWSFVAAAVCCRHLHVTCPEVGDGWWCGCEKLWVSSKFLVPSIDHEYEGESPGER
jgi:hypothetical protein